MLLCFAMCSAVLFSIIPEEPKRDGFEFVGWFKEEDCLNEWNFETDTLPKAQKTEDGEDFYAETKLYAKWIKK